MYILLIFGLLTLIVICWWYYSDKVLLPQIEDKVVLVTGSAAGFGKCIVEKCLDEGMTVFAGCRREESVDQLIEEFKDKRGNLEAFQMDVTSDKSVNDGRIFVEEKLKECGKGLHAVINNAGVQGCCFYDDFLNLDDYKETINVNTLGAVRVTHAFKDLIKRSKGRFIFCTSGTVMFPSPSMCPYAVSKWGLSAFANCLRYEMYHYGVNVCDIQPGVYRTNFGDLPKLMKSMEAIWDRGSEELREEYGYYFYNKLKRLFVDLFEMAPTDFRDVKNAYFHAISAKYPRPSYIVGWDAALLYRPYSWLTSRLQIFCTLLFMRFFNAPVPAAVDTNEY